ncbi:MAG: MBL fold metallo-hydrolase [Rhodocyclaceae bacterium]|nr:MBL fold metallo-hydrolase [Rhodocyclaceae bacterium]
MKYHIVTVTPFEQNATLLWDPATRKAAIVDPGGEIERLLAAVASRELSVEKLLLTHGHIDHVGGAAALAQRLGVPIEGPQREDAFWLDELPEQSRLFGFPATAALRPDRWLDDGDTVTVGNAALEVIHTPGHTPGHVCFFDRAARLALVGDVLFSGSIGRTDFPRGDFDTLIASIRGKLFALGDEVEFIPGHGPMSTFGRERLTNPYVGEFA